MRTKRMKTTSRKRLGKNLQTKERAKKQKEVRRKMKKSANIY
jgi:hypothetical protein